MMATAETITDQEWIDRFGPELLIEDYDHPWLKIQEMQPYIWTVLDCDGLMVISSGWHYVNRMNYYITVRPVPEGAMIDVIDPDEQEMWEREQEEEEVI